MGNTAKYGFDKNKGTLNSFTDAKGSSTINSYDDMDRLIGTYKASEKNEVEYFALNNTTTGDKGTTAISDTSIYGKDENGKSVLYAKDGTKALYNLGINKNSGTMATWFNAATNGDVKYIIASANSANRCLLTTYIAADNKLKLAVRNASEDWKEIISSDITVNSNTWNYAACKWQISGTTLNLTLFLNDKKYIGSTNDFKDFTGTNTAVGCFTNGQNSLNGLMSNFMYSSQAIDDNEILNNFKNNREIKSNCISSNSYAYENDRIKAITHNGFSYNFGYDSLGNNTTVSVGNQNLITNDYESRTGKLLKSTYGNGQVVSDNYDLLDRVTAKLYNGNVRYTYEYDASGNLGYHQDLVNGVNYRYIYDNANRLVNVKDSIGNILRYGFDENNNTNVIFDKVNSIGNITSYGYDKDNRPTETSYNRYNMKNNAIEYFPLNGDTTGTKGTNITNGKGVFVKDEGKTVLSAKDGNLALYNLGVNKNSGTMSTWLKTTTSNTVRYITATQGKNDAILHMYIGNDNKLKLGLRNNAGTWVELLTSKDIVNINQWTYAAFTWQLNGNNLNCTLYLNNNSVSGNINDFSDFSDGNTAVGSYVNGNYSINGYVEQFAYSKQSLNSNEILDMYYGGRGVIEKFSYDSIGRQTNKKINTGTADYNTTYNYLNGINGSSTTKISSISNNGNAINYTYDKNGNIETITENGKTIKYYYNELNELVREDNQVLNKTIVYTYDAGGNITSKVEYNYTTGAPSDKIISHSYAYGDSNWKDKLTVFDGKAITTDAIGNLTNYDGWTYSWEEGRQLSSMSKAGTNISFKYNDVGIRTEKTVNGVVTKYHLVGNEVTYEDNGTDKIYYTYDSAGKLVSMNLNGVEYYYIRNGQGDITGLFDKNGIQVVSYVYDSWGKLISIDGSLKDSVGVKNPYRYRGYRYDSETGLYYLQSRYYSPEWGRFINGDGITGATGELLSHNMFAYCKNNRVPRLKHS